MIRYQRDGRDNKQGQQDAQKKARVGREDCMIVDIEICRFQWLDYERMSEVQAVAYCSKEPGKSIHDKPVRSQGKREQHQDNRYRAHAQKRGEASQRLIQIE